MLNSWEEIPHVGNKLHSSCSLDLKETPSQASRTYRGKRAMVDGINDHDLFYFWKRMFRSATHIAGKVSCAEVILLGRHREDHLDVPSTRVLRLTLCIMSTTERITYNIIKSKILYFIVRNYTLSVDNINLIIMIIVTKSKTSV